MKKEKPGPRTDNRVEGMRAAEVLGARGFPPRFRSDHEASLGWAQYYEFLGDAVRASQAFDEALTHIERWRVFIDAFSMAVANAVEASNERTREQRLRHLLKSAKQVRMPEPVQPSLLPPKAVGAYRYEMTRRVLANVMPKLKSLSEESAWATLMARSSTVHRWLREHPQSDELMGFLIRTAPPDWTASDRPTDNEIASGVAVEIGAHAAGLTRLSFKRRVADARAVKPVTRPTDKKRASRVR